MPPDSSINNEVIDLTGEEDDDETPAPTLTPIKKKISSAKSPQSPEVASSTKTPVDHQSRDNSDETPTPTISPEAKAIVALALLEDGRHFVYRAQLSEEVSHTMSSLLVLTK